MLDYHVHIGQFNEVYYDAHQVFSAIENAGCGVSEIYYSSTSSCRYDVELSKIEEEIEYAQNSGSSLKVRPYLWYVPKYAELNISVKSASESFDYAGVKLHPYAQKWDFQNPAHLKALDDIFSWASENKKHILIHTGKDEDSRPSRFEPFIKTHPRASVILAHSCPVAETLSLMQKYTNVKCDVSFCSNSKIRRLFSHGVISSRILFGTDFPVTAYLNSADSKNLSEQYKYDCRKLSFFLKNS